MHVRPTTALPQSLGHPVLWKRGSQGETVCGSVIWFCIFRIMQNLKMYFSVFSYPLSIAALLTVKWMLWYGSVGSFNLYAPTQFLLFILLCFYIPQKDFIPYSVSLHSALHPLQCPLDSNPASPSVLHITTGTQSLQCRKISWIHSIPLVCTAEIKGHLNKILYFSRQAKQAPRFCQIVNAKKKSPNIKDVQKIRHQIIKTNSGCTEKWAVLMTGETTK